MNDRIAIVAGESSGDRLGAGLMRELSNLNQNLRFEGLLGPEMLKLGGTSLYPMDRLSVMGLLEILQRYPEIRGIRNGLLQYYANHQPKLFIGIDAPEFNLNLTPQLKNMGIKTVQYVSPQVWAWRQYRVNKIRRCIDLMLVLFPFEERFYLQHGLSVHCVGHPLADEIPLVVDKTAAREELSISLGKKVLALLPGSRKNEWRYHCRPFLETAHWIHQREPEIEFIVAAYNHQAKLYFQDVFANLRVELPIRIVAGQTRQVITASDAVLTVSGTASLETMLLKRPMVVAYRMGAMSYAVAKLLVKVPFIALPNILAGRELVPEFIQDEVGAENLGAKLLTLLAANQSSDQHVEFTRLHLLLRRNASQQAAMAIAELF